MNLQLALYAFSIALVLQGTPELVRPTPPANRFDAEHYQRLAGAWGRPFETGAATRQRPSIRGLRWRVAGDGRRTERIVVEGTAEVASFDRARTTITVDEDEVRFVRAPGIDAVFVNGEGFVGDPERRGYLGVPVLLRAGDNRLELVGFAGGELDVALWDPVPPLVLGHWAMRFPEPRELLSLPVFNASAREADSVHFHYGRAGPRSDRVPGLGEWSCSGFAPPLGMMFKRSFPFDIGDFDPDPELCLAPMYVYGASGVTDCRIVDLRAIEERHVRGATQELRWPRLHTVRWYGFPPPAILIYETVGQEDVVRETLAVARYCQQLIWYRTGQILHLVSDAWLASKAGDGLRESVLPRIRFGRLDGAKGTLVIRRVASDRYEIRASDAAAMRRVYRVDPFFTERGESETFRVR